MRGIKSNTFVDDFDPLTPTLSRREREKRRCLSTAMRIALGGNAGLSGGIDHRAYRHALDPLPDGVRAALIADFA